MARTRKSIQPLNLYKYDVLIEDQGPRSDYFKISQFDGYFYGGRNAFLVAGATALRANSKILVEILNVDGKTVYSAPIPEFVEGNSRLVQVEVYSDTPIGPGKIVLLGCVDTYVDGTPIPDEWKDKYNVRWITDVIISPLIHNKTPIRFIKNPSIVVAEKFYSSPSSSIFSENIQLPIDVSFSPKYYNIFPNGYLLNVLPSNSASQFSSDYINGTITGSVILTHDGIQESASIRLPITKIYNKYIAESQGSLLYTQNKNLILSGQFSGSGQYSASLDPFGDTGISGSIYLQYNKLTTKDTGSAISFANIRMVDLTTLSGEINKVRLSYKASTEPGEFITLSDVSTGVQELLAVDSASKIAETGKFNKVVIDDYWYAATMSIDKLNKSVQPPEYYTSSSLTTNLLITQSNDQLLDAINATPEIQNGTYIGGTSYFIGTKSPSAVRLFPRVEYTLAFDAFVSKVSASVELVQDDCSLEVYLIKEPASNSKIYDKDTTGQLLGTITPTFTSKKQNFENVEFNFNPKIIESGDFALRFIFYGGFWNIANVSVKPAQEAFFSPDEVDILVPVIDYEDSILTFKAEFLDINNNSAGMAIYSLPTYITGSNKYVKRSDAIQIFPYTGSAMITGSLGITGSLTVSGSGTFRNIGPAEFSGSVNISGSTTIIGPFTASNLNITGILSATSQSIQYVSSSQLNISTNKITVNTNNLLRFGGLSVIEVESIYNSGSLYWDSLYNRWIYESVAGGSYNSAILIAGPKNTGALGAESGLTSGYVPYATGDDHIDNSVIYQLSGKIGVGTNTPSTALDVNGVIQGTTFTSTQTTGTAPFTVASTTAVTNLNADYLDGNHASAFYLASNPSGYTTNTGTVTSVGGTGTVSGLTLTGTVTTTGNLTLGGTLSVAASNFSSQTANYFLAAPNGSAGTPTFRAIVAADIPTLNQNTTGQAGSVASAVTFNNGGSGAASGTTYDGGTARTVSYNTIGAPSTSGTNATGTWGISITGNAATVNNLSTSSLFNNMGEVHGTRTSFDISTPSYDFGYRYVQGSTNGPGTGGSQFYSWYIGLGSQYPATGAGSYGAMFAIDRNVAGPYLSVRFNENNSFSSWKKIYAGYADTAGNITAYTINQNLGTSNTPTFNYVIFKDSVNSNTYGLRGLSGVITLDGGVQYPTAWNFQYGNSSNSAMYISSSGYVGIGTTTPATKLTVEGAVLVGNTVSGYYVSTSKLHVGSTSGTTQVSFEDVGVSTAAIALDGDNFSFGHQNSTVTYYFRHSNTYNGDYANTGTAFVAFNPTTSYITATKLGIGTTSPASKLHISGVGDNSGLQINRLKTYVTENLTANATQARRFEIARLGIDYNDWNQVGVFMVELFENYYSRGVYKRYQISYGYNNNSYSCDLVEYNGTGDNNAQVTVGSPTLVTGDQYYLPVYVDVRYYGQYDARIQTNRELTTSNPPAIGSTYINLNPTPSNISDFTADSQVKLAPQGGAYIFGNVGVGTSSPSTKLHVYTGTTANIAMLEGSAGQYLQGGTDAGGFYLEQVGTTSGNRILRIQNSNGSGTYTQLFLHGANQTIYTSANVNFGIGTTNPLYKLDVNGGARLADGGSRPTVIETGGMIYSQGDTGGWAMGHHIKGSSGTDLGGFGFYGGVNALTYYYIGTSYLSPTIVVNSSNNVGIGTTSPATKLHVSGSTATVRIQSPNYRVDTNAVVTGAYSQYYSASISIGQIGFSTVYPGEFLLYSDYPVRIVPTSALNVSGEIRASSEITAYYSDARLKNFHGTIKESLVKINKLNGYYFTENETAKSLGYKNDKIQIGLSAQEVQAVLPEAVVPAPINDMYLTVKYEKLVPLLVEAIKEQQILIEQLQERVNMLGETR